MKNKYGVLWLVFGLLFLGAIILLLGKGDIMSFINSRFNTASVTPLTSTDTFYRAVDLNGGNLLNIGGNDFDWNNLSNFSYSGLPSSGLSTGTLVPAPSGSDASALRTMLLTGIYNPSEVKATFSDVPKGKYKVIVYTWEDSAETINEFFLNGNSVQSNVSSGTVIGSWKKLGPWTTTVDVDHGSIEIKAKTANNDAVILSGIELWQVNPPLTPTPVSYSCPTTDGTFYRGIDFDGNGGTFCGKTWGPSSSGTVSTDAVSQGPTSMALVPALNTDAERMIRSGIYNRKGNTRVTLTSIEPGVYDVYLYVFEDSNPRTTDIKMNGTRVATVSNLAAGAWKRLSLGSIKVENGKIELTSTTSDADAAIFSGVELWKTVVVSTPTPSPVSSPTPTPTPTPTPVASVSVAPSIAPVPSPTPVASVAPSPSPTNVPFYNPPAPACLSASPACTFSRAVDLGGTVGSTIDGRYFEAGYANPKMTYTGQERFPISSVSFLQNTDPARASMIRDGVFHATDVNGNGTTVRMDMVPSGEYVVYLYTFEDNKQTTNDIFVDGVQVENDILSGPAGTWKKLGPWRATVPNGSNGLPISSGTITIKSNTSNPVGDALIFSGIELWRTGNAPTVAVTPTPTPSPIVSPTPTPVVPTPTPTPTPSPIVVYNPPAPACLSASPACTPSRAIDLGGTVTNTIDGRNWEIGYSNPNMDYTGQTRFPITPGTSSTVSFLQETSPSRAAMIRDGIYRPTDANGVGTTAAVKNIKSGTYDVYLYTFEDSGPTSNIIWVDGVQVPTTVSGGPKGTWQRLGPWSATVPNGASGPILNGTITVQSRTLSPIGDALIFSGIELWRTGDAPTFANLATPSPTPTPVLKVTPTPSPSPSPTPTTTPSGDASGLAVEFEMAPVSGKNPSGVAVSNGQVVVEGDWQFGAYGSLHFKFNSAHNGADQGARIVTYTLPAPDGAYHKIEAKYDLQSVTVKRDGVEVVKDWLDQQTTEIPTKSASGLSFNTSIRNIKTTPFTVTLPSPTVEWQGVIGNSSVPQYGNGVWSAFLPAIAMTAYKDSMFVTWGYNEGKPLVGRFNVSNPQKLEMFGFRIGAGQSSESPIDLSVSGDTLYVKLANGKVVRFNASTLALIGAERGESIAFPAPATRPIANADQTWSFNGKTVGEPGGYANGTDIKATRFGHWFIDGSKINRSASAFQTDGKVWVSDTATARLIRFNADGTPEGTVVHWTPHSYVMAIDKNDRTRSFNRFIEYRNGVPFRFYGNVMPSDAFGFGEGFTGVATVGGRTLALALQRSGSPETKQLMELTSNGVVSISKGLPKESRLNADGTVSDLNKIVKDGVTYSFAWGKTTGNHLTATKNGSTLWSTFPTGDNVGKGTFDLRTEYPAQPGTFAVAGNYVIVATQMEFWRVGRFTGQGNQLFIFDKATGQFLRQFGLPMMMRGEVDNPPGTASNMFTIDAEATSTDGKNVTVWANDESNRGIVVWKITP